MASANRLSGLFGFSLLNEPHSATAAKVGDGMPVEPNMQQALGRSDVARIVTLNACLGAKVGRDPIEPTDR